MTRIAPVVLLALLATAPSAKALALIRGDAGNKPVFDPGWPNGAASIFNHAGRAAWWEGPPFGGGQWHSECRGDAKALNVVLTDFAKLDAKTKRVVVHDGAGHSFWLAPNNEPEKLAAAKIDWVFMVWQSANWDQLHKMPADLNPTDPADTTPPAQIDVFTGTLNWADVKVPEGLEIIDQRLVAHGFTAADGAVLEGKVTDQAQPIAVTMRLQRVEPQKTGGYLYPNIAEAKTDAQGKWILKNAPMGWVRVVIEAEGFVPRVVGYLQLDNQPRWQSFGCNLLRAAPVAGRVVDEGGMPLEGVDVRFDHVQPESDGKYESPVEYKVKTDAKGRFRAENLPAAKASIWLYKAGYIRPGLGLAIKSPKNDVELTMMQSASVRITIDFAGKERPAGYMVKVEPEGGEAVGKYGGAGDINPQNQIAFESVPPGRYVFRGRPNPSSGDDWTESVTIELKRGQASEVTLKAK